MNKRVFIVHGWGGGPNHGWLPWAKQELEKRGYLVTIPQLPDTEYPKIIPWVSKLSETIGKVKKDTILVGFSMGCQTILRFLETLSDIQKVDKVILIAGFGSSLNGLSDDEKPIVEPWLTTPIDYEKVKNHADKFIAVLSDNDPFVALEENQKLFEEKLNAEVIVKRRQGHFNEEAGVFELPILLELID